MTANQSTAHNHSSAQDDLAFMRALVSDDGSHNKNFGLIYLTAGLLYGAQCLLNGLFLAIPEQVNTLTWMAVGWLPTVFFLIVLFVVSMKDRKRPRDTGTTKRAIGAAFSGAGIANLILALIFGYVAYQKKDWSFWLLYPVVVSALQGAIWFAAAILRRSQWHGLTAIAWFIAAILLGLLLDHTQGYLYVLGLTLLLCMALPGYVIVKSTPQNT